MSIRNKIIALVMVCVVGMMGFAALVVYKQQKEWIQKEAEFFGKESARDALRSVYTLMYAGSDRYASAKKAVLDQFKSNPAVMSVRLFRSPLMEAQYGPTPPENTAKSRFENMIFSAKKPITNLVDEGGNRYVEVIIPMLAESGECLKCHVKATEGDLLGGLYIQVKLDAFGEKIKKDRRDILLITVALMVFMAGFTTSMLKRLLGTPIESVVKVAETIAQGRISNFKLKPGNDEVGRLVGGISKMIDSLTMIAASAQQMAGGDLSQSIGQSGELADAFNDMVRSLGGIVFRIRQNSDSLGQALAKIADIAREQSEGATLQITEVAGLQQTMNELSQNAAKAASQSDMMFEMAQNSVKSAKTGREAAKEGSNTMNQIASGMSETAGKAEELKEKTQQIGKVLEIINDIAMETKILSVNASIEASKAGEMGKGFTVVAAEIAKLAENVVQSTSSIKEINDEIQSFSGVLLDTIAKTSHSAESGVATMKKMDQALERILDAANKTAVAAQKISTISRSQSDQNRAVLMQMEGISVKANDFSRSAQHTADEAGRIKTLFESLEAEVSRFKVAPGGIPTAPPAPVAPAAPVPEEAAPEGGEEKPAAKPGMRGGMKSGMRTGMRPGGMRGRLGMKKPADKPEEGGGDQDKL